MQYRERVVITSSKRKESTRIINEGKASERPLMCVRFCPQKLSIAMLIIDTCQANPHIHGEMENVNSLRTNV